MFSVSVAKWQRQSTRDDMTGLENEYIGTFVIGTFVIIHSARILRKVLVDTESQEHLTTVNQ